ncbi:hypothetical protein G6F43_003034 [Rhizopus delemar]|nr:hypothetical protein G6F43_003034 [Rhizopus delemar]
MYLDLVVSKHYYLNPKGIAKYSEEDFKLKFWSHIIEESFSISPFFLHWVDTVPDAFSLLSLKLKVDPRLLFSVSSNQPDYSTGEFSKVVNSTKLYEDKLKAVLITKKHLNSLLGHSNNKTVVPFFLIMGFKFTACQFPITKDAVNNGSIEEVIKCIDAMKRSKVPNKMSQITDEASTNTVHSERAPIFWPKALHGMFLDDATEHDDNDEAEEEYSDLDCEEEFEESNE